MILSTIMTPPCSNKNQGGVHSRYAQGRTPQNRLTSPRHQRGNTEQGKVKRGLHATMKDATPNSSKKERKMNKKEENKRMQKAKHLTGLTLIQQRNTNPVYYPLSYSNPSSSSESESDKTTTTGFLTSLARVVLLPSCSGGFSGEDIVKRRERPVVERFAGRARAGGFDVEVEGEGFTSSSSSLSSSSRDRFFFVVDELLRPDCFGFGVIFDFGFVSD